MTSNNCTVRPQIEQGVDVTVERIRLRGNVQYVMHQHVRLERSHEEQCRRSRVAATNRSRFHRTAEIVRDHRDPAARRAVGGARIERHHQRARPVVHVDRNVLGDDFFDEGNKALGNAAQYDPRVRSTIHLRQAEDEIGRTGKTPAHRDME